MPWGGKNKCLEGKGNKVAETVTPSAFCPLPHPQEGKRGLGVGGSGCPKHSQELSRLEPHRVLLQCSPGSLRSLFNRISRVNILILCISGTMRNIFLFLTPNSFPSQIHFFLIFRNHIYIHFRTQHEFILSPPPSSVPPKYCLLFYHLQR